MINRKAGLFFGLIVLVCVFFTTCNWDNPVMEKWWKEESEDPYYVPITKTVPQIVYETIIEQQTQYIYEEIEKVVIIHEPEVVTQYITLPPEVLLQYIEIINIDFIVFSGDSQAYDEQISPSGGTNLTGQEMSSNHAIFDATKNDLITNADYMLILHGHANPVTGTAAEAVELAALSLARANSVKAALLTSYGVPPFPPPPSPLSDIDDRITTKGYGGERNISGSSLTYAGLNRRVEVILFRILTAPATGTGTGGGG